MIEADQFDPHVVGDDEDDEEPFIDIGNVTDRELNAIGEELRYRELCEIATYTNLEPIRYSNEATTMKKNETADNDQRFDPWVGVEPSRTYNPDDEDSPPQGWTAMSRESRERIGFVLCENDPAGAPPLGPWRRLRARCLKPVDQAESGAIAEALDRYYIADPVERAAWAEAVREVSRLDFHHLFQHGVRKLRRSGDVLRTLRLRRETLDTQIARLEQREQFAANTGRVVTR